MSTPEAEPSYLPVGTLLGERYEITGEIGRGGFSVVFRAKDRELGTDVAVKLLVPPPATAELARERMRREVQAVRGLAHANIVAVHDFLQDTHRNYVVMEYIAGPDLSIRVRDRGSLRPDEVVRIGQGIASALSVAHRRGILHRDVKPQNILLDPDGRARLTDFGSARLDGQATVTQTGGLVGTINYTPPEVMAGQRGDARADIYSLGMTLYFALTGDLPPRPSPHLPPPAESQGHHPSWLCTGIPGWLDDAIACATAALPGDRFPSAAAFLDALDRGDDGSQPGTESPMAVWRGPAGLDFCLLCGVPEPLGLGVCARCGPASAGDDALIFVHRPQSVGEREHTREAIRTLLGDRVDERAITTTLRSERALARVPLRGADRVIDQLSRRNIPSHAVTRWWAPLPGSLYGIAGLMLATGLGAGMMALPPLLWASPMLAALVVLEAQRRLRKPLLAPTGQRPLLPETTRRRVAEVVARLPAGTPLSLLADLVRMAQAVAARQEKAGQGDRVTGEVESLVLHACDAALDLQELEESLNQLERQRDRNQNRIPSSRSTIERAERGRDALVQRMLDAITSLGHARIVAAEAGGTDLEELGAALEQEVKTYAEAVREVGQLTGGRAGTRGK